MRESKFREAMEKNGWTRRVDPLVGVEYLDTSTLWSITVARRSGRDWVTMLGPEVSPGGFVKPEGRVIEVREAGPFGWPSTAYAMLRRHGFSLKTQNHRRRAA